MRLELLMIGKTRRPEMCAVIDDYVNRIRHSCPLEVVEVRDADRALKKLDADRRALAILLDAGGRPSIRMPLPSGLANFATAGRGRSSLCAEMPGASRN